MMNRLLLIVVLFSIYSCKTSSEVVSEKSNIPLWENVSYSFDLNPQNDEGKIPERVIPLDTIPTWNIYWPSFVCQNIKYPSDIRKGGTMIGYFTVDVDGSINDIAVIDNGVDKRLQKALETVLHSFPKAKSPGIYKGKKVKSGTYISLSVQRRRYIKVNNDWRF